MSFIKAFLKSKLERTQDELNFWRKETEAYENQLEKCRNKVEELKKIKTELEEFLGGNNE